MRLVIERKISDDLSATFDFQWRRGSHRKRSQPGRIWRRPSARAAEHSLASKVSGYVPASGTRWIASYKSTSGNALSTVDAFNASPGQADPYLSIFIASRSLAAR